MDSESIRDDDPGRGPDEMETQSEATDRLTDAGYELQYSVDEDGSIIGGTEPRSHDEFVVDEMVRFEGMSNPDDEAILLAVSVDGAERGTLLLPYGPDISGDQADAVRSLVMRHRQDDA